MKKSFRAAKIAIHHYTSIVGAPCAGRMSFCSRNATRAEEIDRKYGEQPPLLAVEVLSPNDSLSKIIRRVREQLHFGTRLVWVVDPQEGNVIVYRPGREEYVVGAAEELTGDDVLPDFRCRVAEFFALPGK